jgi:hypothetical protein
LSSEDKGFNARIFACIDSAISSFLGRDVVSVLYHAAKERNGFNKDELARRPEALLETLRGMLGLGFSVLEKRITKEIEESFGIQLNQGSSLVEAIEQARKSYLLGAS